MQNEKKLLAPENVVVSSPFLLLISVTTIRFIKSYTFATLTTISQTPITCLQRSIHRVQNDTCISNAKWVITQTC